MQPELITKDFPIMTSETSDPSQITGRLTQLQGVVESVRCPFSISSVITDHTRRALAPLKTRNHGLNPALNCRSKVQLKQRPPKSGHRRRQRLRGCMGSCRGLTIILISAFPPAALHERP